MRLFPSPISIQGFSMDLGCRVLWDIRTGDRNIPQPLNFAPEASNNHHSNPNDNNRGSGSTRAGFLHIPVTSLGLRHPSLFGSLGREVNSEVSQLETNTYLIVLFFTCSLLLDCIVLDNICKRGRDDWNIRNFPHENRHEDEPSQSCRLSKGEVLLHVFSKSFHFRFKRLL